MDPVVWSAPGRVNVIGEHTDYNDGFVLPIALAGARTTVSALRSRTQWTVASDLFPEPVSFGPEDLSPGRVGGWAGYVAGVVWVLREAGVPVPPADLRLRSTLALGAGLSSSAALECSVLGALLDLAEVDVPRDQWPALAQRAENAYVGVPCGIMDQSASVLARAGHALFLDCRTQAVAHVPFALEDAGLGLVLINTNAPHRHADNEYALRRSTCEAAARQLGVPALRDVTDLASALASLGEDVMRRRVRHVVTENARVLATVSLLQASRIAEIGPLLTESHQSLRDDFEVTVPELDTTFELALDAGALGARMTGGGFGGSVIALAPLRATEAIADLVARELPRRGFAAPTISLVAPADGIRRES